MWAKRGLFGAVFLAGKHSGSLVVWWRAGWFRQRVWLDDALSTVPTVLFVAGSALQSDLVEATERLPPTGAIWLEAICAQVQRMTTA